MTPEVVDSTLGTLQDWAEELDGLKESKEKLINECEYFAVPTSEFSLLQQVPSFYQLVAARQQKIPNFGTTFLSHSGSIFRCESS